MLTSPSSKAEPFSFPIAGSPEDGGRIGAPDRELAHVDVRKALERTVLALQAAEIGVWEWDFVSGGFIWDQRMRALWSLPEDANPSYEIFRGALNPADIERSDGAIAAVLLVGQYRQTIGHSATGQSIDTASSHHLL